MPKTSTYLARVVMLSLAFCSAANADERFQFRKGSDSVVDRTTGLTWRRCPVGEYLDSSLLRPEMCKGDAQLFTHPDANEFIKGQKDWRLPTLSELGTLHSHPVRNGTNYINTIAFPRENRHQPLIIWSSTKHPTGPLAFGMLDFSDSYDRAFYRERVPENRGFLLLVKR